MRHYLMSRPGPRIGVDVRDRVLASLRAESGTDSRWDDAAALLDLLVLGEFEEFMTIPGYRLLP